MELVRTIGAMALFSGGALLSSLRGPFFWRETFRQMERMFSRCVVPVVAVLLPVGGVVALQGLIILKIFSAESLLSGLVSTGVLRELSPGIASLMVAAQAGSSMAAELGAMRVKEEIDAQEIMAVNPLNFLVTPRLLSGILVTPALNIVGCLSGIAGGYLVAVVLKGMNRGIFVANAYNFLHLSDLWQGIVKTVVFGTIISVVSCYNGYHVTGGAEGVGKAANRSVVQSIIAIIICNYFLSSAFLGT